ncbi:MAG: response regulator transcription factor [Planctomycetes bacterium]|nr:response regulator transcription factor [Planctomycetota bacterium]
MISILLADDHKLVRDTFAHWLSGIEDFRVVGVAANAESAVLEAVRTQPDLAILDVDMPGAGSFQAASTIRIRTPKTRVLFLSAYSNDRYIEQAIGAGASGYASKSEPLETVEKAIRAVVRGERYFSPEAMSRIVVERDRAGSAGTIQTRRSSLTDREIEVLRYLARGMAKKEIATVMSLSLGTVNNHAANLMRKLDIHDRVELTRFAIREGLIEA